MSKENTDTMKEKLKEAISLFDEGNKGEASNKLEEIMTEEIRSRLFENTSS